MLDLPEPTPTATAAGQDRNALIDQRADQFLAAINDVAATRYRDDRAVPKIGTAPPVAQPGRPPMSQGATDASALMLSGGVASVLVGSAVSLVMVTSGHADPVVCGIVFGSPAVLALAASRLLKRARQVVEAAPAEVHNHYNGPVHQDQSHTQSRNTGVWVKNDNRQ